MITSDLLGLGDNYWKHVGVAEDLIKMGARYGLIENSDANRVLRMIVSQPDGMFAPSMVMAPEVMREPSTFKDWFNSLKSQGSAEQQGANFAPRIEGHHGVSVSSTHSAGQHLPITDHGRFINHLTAEGVPVGTQAREMWGLSKPAHTTNSPLPAHINPVTGMVDEGFWQGAFDGSKYNNPIELAEQFANDSAMPQIRLAEMAQNQPGELEIQDTIAAEAGVDKMDLFRTDRNDKGKTFANKVKAALAKDEFDATGLNKVVYGGGPTKRGGARSSNKTILDERTGANLVRRDLGLGGNEQFAQDLAGKWIQTIRSNNPRRRL